MQHPTTLNAKTSRTTTNLNIFKVWSLRKTIRVRAKLQRGGDEGDSAGGRDVATSCCRLEFHRLKVIDVGIFIGKKEP